MCVFFMSVYTISGGRSTRIFNIMIEIIISGRKLDALMEGHYDIKYPKLVDSILIYIRLKFIF